MWIQTITSQGEIKKGGIGTSETTHLQNPIRIRKDGIQKLKKNRKRQNNPKDVTTNV